MNGEVNELGRQALKKCGGDWERAAKWMRKQLDENTELMRELLDPLIDGQIWYVIRMLAHKQRACGPTCVGEDDGRQGIESGAARQLLDYPLRGGLPLRKAKRPDIRAEREWHQTLVQTNAFKDRWYGLIEKQLRDDRKVVESVLTEERLQKLWSRARE